jgi:hypothetical protein
VGRVVHAMCPKQDRKDRIDDDPDDPLLPIPARVADIGLLAWVWDGLSATTNNKERKATTMVDVKNDRTYNEAQRIAARLGNGGEGSGAGTTVKTGDSARRTFHNLHHTGYVKQHGPGENSAPTKGRDILSEYGPDSPGAKARR